MSRKELPEAAEDAIVNELMTKLSRNGHYSEVMKGGDDKSRKAIEASLERHAARQRAAGRKGW